MSNLTRSNFTIGEMTCYPPRPTILPNFIAMCQPAPEISVTKVFGEKKQRKKESYKQTVNDISSICLSACGDNNVEHINTVFLNSTFGVINSWYGWVASDWVTENGPVDISSSDTLTNLTYTISWKDCTQRTDVSHCRETLLCLLCRNYKQ